MHRSLLFWPFVLLVAIPVAAGSLALWLYSGYGWHVEACLTRTRFLYGLSARLEIETTKTEKSADREWMVAEIKGTLHSKFDPRLPSRTIKISCSFHDAGKRDKRTEVKWELGP